MHAIMRLDSLKTVEDLRRLDEGTRDMAFAAPRTKEELYSIVGGVLGRLRYHGLGRADKGAALRLLRRVTGYSRQQLSRLVALHKRDGFLSRSPARGNGFGRIYTDGDTRLLAELDEDHETPNGKAVLRLCQRALLVYGDARFERLAFISVSHIYNLRRSRVYLKSRRTVAKTRASSVQIGERRRPRTGGMAGYLRVDTVHQGDLDGLKGVYYVNAVDEETQMVAAVCVAGIDHLHMLPALRKIIAAFPFRIRGFHTDNGSEYVNHVVAAMLNGLNAEFTKSRPGRTNDNALAESKNAAVLRRHIGHGHIPRGYAPLVDIHLRLLEEYHNFHRPCLFHVKAVDARGRATRTYPQEMVMTPYERLRSMPGSVEWLKPGITFDSLDKRAARMTDQKAARLLKRSRERLLRVIRAQEARIA